MADYVGTRLGFGEIDAPGEWRVAVYDSGIGTCRIAVVELGPRLLTEDGEYLPRVRNSVELLPLDGAYRGVVPDQELESWQNELGYRRLPTRARGWFRKSYVSGVDKNDAPAADDFLRAETERLLRDLREQSIAWRVHARRAESLAAIAQGVDCSAATLESVQRCVTKIAESLRFKETTEGELRVAVATVRSELESVGDLWLPIQRKRFPGLFMTDYSQLAKPELRVLLEYWDCEVWTRSSIIRRGVFVPLTVGERVRIAAAELAGIPECTKRVFEDWLRE